jgi:N-dimethylarginine dimethylaminohydrolase
MKVYRTSSDIDFRLDDCPVVPRAERVMMVSPEHFDVQYVINPHMEGQIGSVDQSAAHAEWNALRETYRQLGLDVSTANGAEDLPDMVFCANQTLPYYNPRSGEQGIILSNMHAEQRRDEVSHLEEAFKRVGYSARRLPEDVGDFEGMGDAIWHPDRYLLWGGHGYRTEPHVYQHLARMLNLRVIALKLSDPDFYHLDTCLSVLDEHTALIYPGAFDEDGIALLKHFFKRLIEAPEDEARTLFACNAHSPDRKHVIIQRGCTETNRRLAAAGFKPVEVDTSEFLKSGGSVFCMKQMFW